MSKANLKLAAAAACSLAFAGSVALTTTANAAPKRHHAKKMARMSPAHPKPGYVGAPGFAGGPPPSTGPAPVVVNGLLGNGGFLGAGLLPQTGVFTGVPIVGQVGL